MTTIYWCRAALVLVASSSIFAQGPSQIGPPGLISLSPFQTLGFPVVAPGSIVTLEMTRPLVVWVSSNVLAPVTLGVSATGVTVMVAVTGLPPKPPSTLAVLACTTKLPLTMELAAGVNFNPALPWAKVMKSPLLIGVVPSCWKSKPAVIPVILKCVTSGPSAALREMTSPLVVWVSSNVLAPVTLGVSATGVTVMVAVTGLPPRPASALAVLACTTKLPLAMELAAGVNFNPALPWAKVMKSPLLIGVLANRRWLGSKS